MPKGFETITVVRKSRGDKLSPTSAAEQRFDVEDCHVIPRVSQEQGKGFVQISGYTVVAPGGSDIRPDDQIIARGKLHSVVGVPGVYIKRRKVKGIMVTLERVATS